MKLIKVLLLCLTILLGCTRESKSSGYEPNNYNIQMNPGNQDNMNIFSREECFCLPIDSQGKRVSEHAALDGGQSRLVVYLYKNKNNKVAVYVPNREKQLLFPDLTLDDGDKLDVRDTERLSDLFYIYSSFTIPNDPLLPSNSNSQSKPNQQHFLPFKYNYATHPSKNEADPLKPHKILIKPGDNANLQLLYPDNSDRFLYIPGGDNNFQMIPDTNISPNANGKEMFLKPEATLEIPDVSEHKPKYQYFPNVNGVPGNKNMITYIPQSPEPNANLVKVVPIEFVENIPNIQKPLNDGSRILIPEPSQSDKNFFYKPPIEYKPNQNLNRPFHQHKQAGQAPSYNDNNIVPSPDIFKEYQIESNNPTSFPLRPQKDTFFTSYKEYSDLQNTMPGKGFEQWFQRQIALIQQNRHSKSQTIDEKELRTFILYALHKNAITVNKAGDLVDSNGIFLDLTNLHLRPILLGDPKEYLKIVDTEECITPHKFPYMEAVLVTLAYPPKILGIVPLRKTPKQIPHYTKPPCNSETCVNKQNCKGTQCYKTKITNLYKPKLTTKVPAKVIAKVTPKATVGTTAKPKIIWPPTKNILRTLKKGQRRSGDDSDFIIEESSEDISWPEDLENDKHEEDEDSLGLRIIGGNPALTSGTIVKNKGRSGQSY